MISAPPSVLLKESQAEELGQLASPGYDLQATFGLGSEAFPNWISVWFRTSASVSWIVSNGKLAAMALPTHKAGNKILDVTQSRISPYRQCLEKIKPVDWDRERLYEHRADCYYFV